MRFLASMAAVCFAAMPVTATSAQTIDTSEQDAQYEACVFAAIGWGYSPNQAAQMCYENIYGDENPDGPPDRTCDHAACDRD